MTHSMNLMLGISFWCIFTSKDQRALLMAGDTQGTSCSAEEKWNIYAAINVTRIVEFQYSSFADTAANAKDQAVFILVEVDPIIYTII